MLRFLILAAILTYSTTGARAQVAVAVGCTAGPKSWNIAKANTRAEAAASARTACVVLGGTPACCVILGDTGNPKDHRMSDRRGESVEDSRECREAKARGGYIGFACTPVHETTLLYKRNCISLAGYYGRGKAVFGVGYGHKAVEADSQALIDCARNGGDRCNILQQDCIK